MKPDDKKHGLYRKYRVQRLGDREKKHRDCEYYVLDLVHDRHAPAALDAYAGSCAAEYPQLAKDLRAKASAWRAIWATRVEKASTLKGGPA